MYKHETSYKLIDIPNPFCLSEEFIRNLILFKSLVKKTLTTLLAVGTPDLAMYVRGGLSAALSCQHRQVRSCANSM